MKRMIAVGTAKAEPGETSRGVIRINSLSTGVPIELPIIVVNGLRDGPRLWINAALHGNEVCGVAAALDALRGVDAAQLNGVLIVTPVSNPLAFGAKCRLTPQDGGNLGESYPGNPDGSITQQIACHHFAAVRANADHLIDMHSAGVTHFSDSYTVLKLGGHHAIEAQALATCLSLGIHLNCSVDTLGRTTEPVPLAGSLDLACMAAGIPAFMVELGNGSRIEPSVARFGAEALLNAMRHLGMLPGPADAFEGQVVTHRRFMLSCRRSGLVRQLLASHVFVPKGEPIAQVSDLYGEVVETVFAPEDLHIISLKEDGVATSGDRVAFAGSV